MTAHRNISGRRIASRLAVAAALMGACASVPKPLPGSTTRGETSSVLPWEDWRDLHRVAQFSDQSRVELRSSFCNGGCRFDRQSIGDERYLDVEAGEGVIFDEVGPGAITRIWMTSGAGTSVPLSDETRVRFYFDGETSARIDLPLVALFDGSAEPFTSPLSEDRLSASGGNYTFVPIPYRERCRVTLSQTDKAPVWFQFHFHRGRHDLEVESFQYEGIAERLAPLRTLLENSGQDPWPSSRSPWTRVSGSVTADTPLGTQLAGPGTITAAQLTADRSRWNELLVQFSFDGVTSSALASEVFASPNGDTIPSSLFLRGTVGAGDDQDTGTLYLPMPFRHSASLSVVPTEGAGPISASLSVRTEPGPIDSDAGILNVQTTVDTQATGDLDLLRTSRATKWVGIYADLSANFNSHPYLEGDERIYLDHSDHPFHHGTGTEDIYAGGFYFDQGPFSHALNGMLFQRLRQLGRFDRRPGRWLGAIPARTVMYRWMLTDAISARDQLLAELEPGPTGDLLMDARHTNFFYARPPSPSEWRRVDAFEVGDPAARQSRNYLTFAPLEEVAMTDSYEGNPGIERSFSGIERQASTAIFTMPAPWCGPAIRLRRVFDAAIAGQLGEISMLALNGQTPLGPAATARLPFSAPNELRRWAQVDLDFHLPEFSTPSAEQQVRIEVDAAPDNEAGLHTEYLWELWCEQDSSIFIDGFESGDTGVWN